MRTLVIMLISFMDGLCQDTLRQHILNSDEEIAKKNKTLQLWTP